MARAWKIIRKILLWTFGVLFALIATLITLAWIFEDEIHLYAIKELGNRLNARIDVRKTHLSFLRSFPSVSIRLEGLTINPLDRDEDFDFISVEDASFTVDFWSFFEDEYEVNTLKLEDPEVRIRHYKNGDWSFGSVFQIPEDTTQTDTGNTRLALQKVSLLNGSLEYEDQQAGDYVKLHALNAALSGDLSADSTEVESTIDLHLDDWRSSGFPIFADRDLSSTLNLMATFGDAPRYRLKDGQLLVNRLALDLSGELATRQNRYYLDLAFKTSKGTFEEFMSLLPGGFLESGKDYNYDGNFRMNGWVKGYVGDAAPDMYADYTVQNGAFQYAGMDDKLHHVDLKGAFLYKSEQPAMSYLRIDTAQAVLNELPVFGKFSIRNFEKPDLDLSLNGKLGLRDIRDFYPGFSEKTQLDGRIDLAVHIRGLLEDFQKLNLHAIRAEGRLAVDHVGLYNEYMPRPLEGLTGTAVVDNSQIRLERLEGHAGKSSFALDGFITDYLSYLLDSNGVLRARLNLRSPLIDLNDWLQAPENSAAATETSAAPGTYQYALPQRVDFTLDAAIDRFAMGKFTATGVQGGLRMYADTLALRSLNLNCLGGAMQVAGFVHVESPTRLKAGLHPIIANVSMQETFRTFDQLAAFALVKDNLSGTFSGDILLRGYLDETMSLEEKSLFSEGEVGLVNGRLVDFEPLEAMAGFVKLQDLRDIQFSDVSTHYRIEGGYFNVPWMHMTANEYKLDVTGRHGFDNSLDYRVRIELPKKSAKRSSRPEIMELVAEDAGEPETRIVIPLKVTGTVDEPKFALDGEFVKGAILDKIEEQKAELREGFKQDVETLFGEQDTMEVEDLVIEEGGEEKGTGLPRLFQRKDSTEKPPGTKPLDRLQNPFQRNRPR